eukprot:scaffold98436_cov66-Phaeocystis_antarctica.AAC.2
MRGEEGCGPRERRAPCDGGTGSIGNRARGGAHVEHVAHIRDAGRVEAQRLVERRRVLPSVERTACDAGRGVDWEAESGGRPRCKQRAGEGSTADWEQGTGEERT